MTKWSIIKKVELGKRRKGRKEKFNKVEIGKIWRFKVKGAL